MATSDVLDSGVKTHLSPSAAELDEMFKTRYSEEDEEYTAYVNTPSHPPPAVDNWFSRPKRQFDNSRGRGNRGGNRYQGHHQRDNRDHRDHRGQGHYGNQGHRDRSPHGYERQGGYRDNRYGGDRRQQYDDRDRSRDQGHRWSSYAGLRPDEY